MTNTPHRPMNNLGEVSHRYDIARELIEIWRCIESALSDVPELVDEISRLRTQLYDTRLNRANLAAAARASIAAHYEGEPDPLSYLRDELRAQGFKPSGGRR